MEIDWQNIESLSDVILDLLPQQHPFRFVDRIVEVDDNHVVGKYQFSQGDYFYKGHFPGNPVTPGVILLESMAQIGVCSLSIYLMLKERGGLDGYTTFFTDADTEFYLPVLPDQQITVKAEKLFWRRMKLKCKADLYLENGDLAARATISGMGVKQ